MNKNIKRLLAAASAALLVASCVYLGDANLAYAMNYRSIKAMGTGAASTASTTSIATRAVTLYMVSLAPGAGGGQAVYFDCFNTANPTLGTTVPTIEFLVTGAASGSNPSPWFFPGGLPLGGTALTCAAVSLTDGSSTVSANVSIGWQ